MNEAPVSDADRNKHLDYLQATVARLAGNSFQLKGWSVGLGSVLIGFVTKDSHPRLAWVALLPILAFWALDGYYLSLERLYRRLYNRVAGLDGEQPLPQFDMDAGRVTGSLWAQSVMRLSVLLVHLALVVIAVAVTMYGFFVVTPHQ
ncbi:MAG: hypothetical protein WB609_01530 [Candidatus Cybelea sp.]